MFKFAFYNLIRNWKRTFLALLAITIGISSLIVLVSIVNGIYQDAASTVNAMQGVIVFKSANMSPIFGTFDYKYYDKLKNLNNVKLIIPEVLHLIGYIDNKKTTFKGPSNSIRAIAMPYNYVSNSYVGNALRKYDGTLLKDSDNGKVMISSKIADDYKKNIGEKINIDGKNYKIVAIFYPDTEYNKGLIFMTLKDIRKLYNIKNDRVSLFELIPFEAKYANNLKKSVEFRFNDLKAMTQQDMLDNIAQVVDKLKLLIIFVTIIATVVAAVGIVNTMLMSVMERFKEIGTLKAVGWTKENILIMILLESLILGFLGGLFSITVGSIFSYLLNYVISTKLTFSLLIYSFVFALLIGLISGLYPAYVASKLDPIVALREE